MHHSSEPALRGSVHVECCVQERRLLCRFHGVADIVNGKGSGGITAQNMGAPVLTDVPASAVCPDSGNVIGRGGPYGECCVILVLPRHCRIVLGLYVMEMGGKYAA